MIPIVPLQIWEIRSGNFRNLWNEWNVLNLSCQYAAIKDNYIFFQVSVLYKNWASRAWKVEVFAYQIPRFPRYVEVNIISGLHMVKFQGQKSPRFFTALTPYPYSTSFSLTRQKPNFMWFSRWLWTNFLAEKLSQIVWWIRQKQVQREGNDIWQISHGLWYDQGTESGRPALNILTSRLLMKVPHEPYISNENLLFISVTMIEVLIFGTDTEPALSNLTRRWI